MEFDEYNVKTIDFGNGTIEKVVYHQSQIRLLGMNGHKGGANLESIISDEAQEERTKKQSYDIKRRLKGYALANDFKWFVTLTIDPKKRNSLDYDFSKNLLLKWCRIIRDRYGKFEYLIVPEFHKLGTVHFHGLIGDLPANFVRATHPKTGALLVRNNREIYNLKDWNYGFTDCEKIVNPEKTASYLTKYITKELMTGKEMFRKKRYFSSQGLKKPEITFEMTETKELENFIPNFGVIETDQYGQNYIEKSIYKLHVNSETRKLYQTDTNYFLKAKSSSSSPLKQQMTDNPK